MDDNNFETLSTTVNSLTQDGYRESFTAKPDSILSAYSKKEYQPEDLKIVKTFRFDGMTDPADESEVFAIEAKDGTKGTLVMSYSAEHGQEVELIKQIEKVK